MKPISLLSMAVALLLSLYAGCDGGNDSGDDSTARAETIQPGDATPERTDEPGPADAPEVSIQPELPLEVEEVFVPSKTPYPPPPYGQTPGGIMKNHSFLDVAAGNKVVKLSDLYKHPTKKLLLLNSSAGWCSACKQEAVELKKIYDKYSAQGFEIWFTLFEDYEGKPAKAPLWEKWTKTMKPNYPTLLDTEFQLGEYFPVESTPLNLMVRLDTMEIIYKSTGYSELGLDVKIGQYLEQIGK